MMIWDMAINQLPILKTQNVPSQSAALQLLKF
jgi:hypothetical protein